MSLVTIFLETLDKINSIQKTGKIVPNPSVSNNYSKTKSNVNQEYPYTNIWDNQIDEMVKGDNYSFKSDPSLFIELILGEPKMLLNRVTSYPEARMTFHMFYTLLDGQEDTMERNIEILKKREILKVKTLGWSPSGCSSFMSNGDILDYKHKNITKYLLTYNFNYLDYTGSIFDPNSGYTFKKLDGITVTFMFIDDCCCPKEAQIGSITVTKDDCSKYKLTGENLSKLLKFNKLLIGVTDGVNTQFEMPEDYISCEIRLNGIEQIEGNDYTVDVNDNKLITYLIAPELNNSLTSTYIKPVQ